METFERRRRGLQEHCLRAKFSHNEEVFGFTPAHSGFLTPSLGKCSYIQNGRARADWDFKNATGCLGLNMNAGASLVTAESHIGA